MEWLFLVSTVMFIISSSLEGVMDFVNWYDWKIPWSKDYWDPDKSWVNKYVDGDSEKGRKKFFFGKLNVPVAFTDGWHLMKFFRNRFREGAIILYTVAMVTTELSLVWICVYVIIHILAALLGFFIFFHFLKWKYK